MKISWLPTLAWAAVVGTLVRIVAYTPLEAKQGAAQKIFYIHVPAAWVAFMAFFLVAVTSAVFLWLHDERLDRFAEPGVGGGRADARRAPLVDAAHHHLAAVAARPRGCVPAEHDRVARGLR